MHRYAAGSSSAAAASSSSVAAGSNGLSVLDVEQGQLRNPRLCLNLSDQSSHYLCSLLIAHILAGVRRSEEFFGFSPVRFVDDVYNCASAYIKVDNVVSLENVQCWYVRMLVLQRGLDQMEEVLLEDPDTRQHSSSIQQGVARTQDKLTKSLDRNIDKFELYIVRNILNVPSHLDTSDMEQMALESSASHTKEEENQLDEVIRSPTCEHRVLESDRNNCFRNLWSCGAKCMRLNS
jgi:hypothetical protein